MTKKIAIALCTIILLVLLASCTSYSRIPEKGVVPALSNARTDSLGLTSMQHLDGYLPVSNNKDYELYFDTKLTGLLVRDKNTGEEWSSIPSAWEEDTVAKGSQKSNLASNIILECYDEGMQAKLVSSYNASVKKGNYTYEIMDGSVRIDYQLDNDMSISLVAYLTADGMEVTIPTVDIKESEELYINNINVLPYFGAVKSDSEGYLFIPDGSGALVDVKKTDVRLPAFNGKLYGWDNGLYIQKDNTPSDSLTAPVFGAKSGDKAFLGVIRQLDYMSSISALCGNTGSEYYSVSPVINYRDFQTIILFKGTSRERAIYDLTKFVPKTDFIVEYRLLTGNDADYAGMALEYQSYLLENNLLKKSEDSQVYLDLTLLGAIRMKDTLAGVPTERIHSFTSFQQAKELLERLKQAGVDGIHLNYKGANSGGYMYELDTAFKPEQKLGGSKGFKALQKYGEQNQVSMAVIMDALTTSKQSRSFKISKDAARYYSNNFTMVQTINPVTYTADANYQPSYILTPPKVLDIVNGFLKTSDMNMTVDRIGKMLYSDFKKSRVVIRQQSGEIWNQILADLKANNDYLPIYGANAYVYPYATNLTGVPSRISNHEIETRQIPFLQIVLHGYLPYSHNPMNLEANYREFLLKAVEYGAMPAFELVAAESELLQRTRYQTLVSADADVWFDRIVEVYLEFKDLFKETVDLAISDHYMAAEGVFCTVYDGRIKVYVNYNSTAVSIDGQTIEAYSYGITE